ncbi:ATP-dependent DNA helicase UvrD2 [Natronoglycomyces albus]|uniref:DNA 3'-5' helicase n=1 Tax=Natronoglycomyces albus TaxID=2811108 RepID=A0A895XWP8_9ACTN|nr:ATP-dependent DNA helicase UvrD2 [Natronoglycomyces albus]QSB06058.1 ATP-dependent DNA helicase UvrD2 [Natronoglycomyces albus]
MTSRADNLEALISHLDAEQRQAVCAEPGPVCILAGAGTGKTRAVTHRIAWRVLRGDLRGQHVTAVTFTARAAGELRDRLRTLGVSGVNARTFHSAALRQLRYFGPRHFAGDVPELMSSTVKFVGIAAARAGVRTDRAKNFDLATELEWAASSLISPDTYLQDIAKLGHEAPMDAADVAKVYAAYVEGKRRSGVMDFSDVLAHTAELIENDDATAERIRNQYRFFVVDEYQDVTPLQQRLLDAWLGERDDLTVVGDASQTIYSFTGATSSYLLGFTRRFPKAQLIRLVRDYRSTPQVVEVANRVIGASQGREAKLRLELIGQRANGPEVCAETFADESEEADAVARRCAKMVADGISPSEIAILYRTNAQSQAYEEALAALGVPSVVQGAERFFERAEVRQAMTAMRSAVNHPEIIEAPLNEAVLMSLEAMGWRPHAVPAGGAQREKYEAVAALVRLSETFQVQAERAGQTASLESFCVELTRRAASQHVPTLEGVTLASLHSAKGLEWDAVFLVGMAEGTLPTTYARTTEALEEERRLLYVGITRARVWLQLSLGLARNPGGRARRVSRFLAQLNLAGFPKAEALPDKPASKKRAKARPVLCSGCEAPLTEARSRKLGRCEDCPSTMDEELFDRLSQWRLQVAKATGKPAFTIFTDVTLIAISEHSPRTDTALFALHGIGKFKMDNFGEAVLCLVKNGTVEEALALTPGLSPDDETP